MPKFPFITRKVFMDISGRVLGEVMISKLTRALKSFIYGATTYDYVLDLMYKQFLHECLLQAAIFGDRYGLPISNYYKLKLLPFLVKKFPLFDREILREKDLLEKL
jgi:hypothetical protein